VKTGDLVRIKDAFGSEEPLYLEGYGIYIQTVDKPDSEYKAYEIFHEGDRRWFDEPYWAIEPAMD